MFNHTWRQLDHKVMKWFSEKRVTIVLLTGPMIQQKSREYAATMNTQFTASNGWFQRFKKRHRISHRTICGEKADVAMDAVWEWLEKVLSIVTSYKLRNIANVDETGLFLRAKPNKTFTLKSNQYRGSKFSNERLTVNMTSA